jgi:hypothetical protein
MNNFELVIENYLKNIQITEGVNTKPVEQHELKELFEYSTVTKDHLLDGFFEDCPTYEQKETK